MVETELVLRLCRTPVPELNRTRARSTMDAGVSIDTLLTLARAWQVEPVVLANLRELFGDTLSAETLALVQQRERDSRALTLGQTLALVDLVRQFASNEIPVVVLKGPAIGVTGYGDPSLRPFADFDLLVRREDIPRARDLALSLGYRREYLPENESGLIKKQHALELSRKSSKVELHCALLSRHLRFGLDTEEVWRESVMIPCAGGEIRGLAPHHQFLFVCAHGAKHHWVSPHWICDVAQLAERLNDEDRDRVVALAARLHVRRILALAIRVARDLVGLEDSRFPETLLRPARETDALVRQVRSQFFPAEKGGKAEPGAFGLDANASLLRFWMRTRERWIDRALSLLQVLFVPTDKDQAAGVAAWLVRPVRLGLRAVDLRRFSR